MGRVYVLQFSDYNDALRALRKLRRRNVRLLTTVVVVDVDHWNKVKDLMGNSNNKDWGGGVAVAAVVMLAGTRSSP